MIFINERNIIKVTFISLGRAIERVGGDNSKVNKVDIINITNIRSTKINSWYKMAKSKNLV